MSQPINLNKARKARYRAEKRKTADANAVAFGRTKAQKDAERAEQDRAKSELDGHKREEP